MAPGVDLSVGSEAASLPSDASPNPNLQDTPHDVAATMSVSALFGSLHLRRTDFSGVNWSEGKVTACIL